MSKNQTPIAEGGKMPTARYRFTIDKTNIAGLATFTVASTLAVRALTLWTRAHDRRSYKTEEDENDFLVARLSWGDDDEKAGADLDRECVQCGVKREFKKAG